MKVLLQAFVTYTLLGWLLPKYFKDKNRWHLSISFVLLLFVLNAIVIVWRQYYLVPNYPVTYHWCIERFEGMSTFELITSWRWIFFKNSANYLPPTVILMALMYYRDQYHIAATNELKTHQELTALRQQLNPHFLFNTLNNIYTLALKKADNTADAVAKLADIMDTLLYKCEEKYVPLEQEIELIENYIALEQLRYGSRVQVEFETDIRYTQRIAPMLILTFVENAFKHGVRHEPTKAKIRILLSANKAELTVSVYNTVPQTTYDQADQKMNIGQTNVQQQLELLYPDSHTLIISETQHAYSIHLSIKTDEA